MYAHPEQFEETHYRSQWSLLLNNEGRRTLHKVAGYMRERTRMGERWTGPLHRLVLPFRVIWGLEDPIAVPGIALELQKQNRNARVVMLNNTGHYPQLEVPERVAEEFGTLLRTP